MSKVSQNQLNLAIMIGANIHLVPEEVAAYYTKSGNRSRIPEILVRLRIPEEPKSEVEQKLIIPDLSNTGPSFGSWLMAREVLHKFLTGETVNLCEMFDIDRATLSRTDIMPVFRPAGATNRDAVNWKKKLGIDVWEEADVMRYKNSEGPQVPELYFINRSVRPDENTLGKEGKSPNQLVKVRLGKNQKWLNLFGYADADNLHFLIKNEHLDPETWTWFPHDQLPDGDVALGRWRADVRKVWLRWYYADDWNSGMGARLATQIPLRRAEPKIPTGIF